MMELWNIAIKYRFQEVEPLNPETESAHGGKPFLPYNMLSVVGWVKRDTGTIFVGFACLNEPQHSAEAFNIVNPTRSVANHRLNPTYDLSFRHTKWIPLQWNIGIMGLAGSDHFLFCVGD